MKPVWWLTSYDSLVRICDHALTAKSYRIVCCLLCSFVGDIYESAKLCIPSPPLNSTFCLLECLLRLRDPFHLMCYWMRKAKRLLACSSWDSFRLFSAVKWFNDRFTLLRIPAGATDITIHKLSWSDIELLSFNSCPSWLLNLFAVSNRRK